MFSTTVLSTTLRRALSAVAAPALALAAAPAFAADTIRVDAPITHDNLSIYLLRGASAAGAVPLTLAEAMAKGAISVLETGNVNQLTLDNSGGEDVFVQAGDIVKGGQQDRVLTVSLLIPAKSGKMAIGAFCVEQGRWSARGKEDVKKFASAEKALPSREAKLAMLAPKPAPTPAAAARPAEGRTASTAGDPRQQRRNLGGTGDETGSRQSEVWAYVGQVQGKLAKSLNGSVSAPQSASSLQLSLENQKLAEARAAYIKVLQGAGASGADVIGVAIAINGRLNSAEVYPSHGLFAKMWPKLLDAAATEAIGEKAAKVEAAPDAAAVLAFLAAAEAGKASEQKLDERLVRETRDGSSALVLETRQKSGAFLHRSYLAK